MFDSVNNSEKRKRRGRRSAYDESVHKILSDDSEFIVNEAYKAARTNIMFSLHDNEGCKSIICTSAMPGEGKTTTCVNMAISFAQTCARVVLIDADLRKPKIERYMGINNDRGLSDYLGKFADDVSEVITPVKERKFDCITAGRIPPNPSELLGSDMMDKLLSELGEKYDYIFVDAPPVNVVTDAIVLSKKCTGVMLVVRENDTTHDMLDSAVTALRFAEAKIVGIIVNGSIVKMSGKYKYRKRKYGIYGKGYGYGEQSPESRRKRAESFSAAEKNAAADIKNSADKEVTADTESTSEGEIATKGDNTEKSE